jgi:hypothetical protein
MARAIITAVAMMRGIPLDDEQSKTSTHRVDEKDALPFFPLQPTNCIQYRSKNMETESIPGNGKRSHFALVSNPAFRDTVGDRLPD